MYNINHAGDRSAEVSNNHIAMTVDRSVWTCLPYKISNDFKPGPDGEYHKMCPCFYEYENCRNWTTPEKSLGLLLDDICSIKSGRGRLH